MSYYSLLGVDKGSNEETIRKAFRSLAKTHHPDRGGDAEKFKAISHAAGVLQDPALRAVYDRDGEKGLQQHQQNSHHPHHPHLHPHHQYTHRGEPRAVVVKVGATLEEIFTGVEKLAQFSWNKPCSDCRMTGCKPGKHPAKCRDCRGAGLIVRVQQLGPGIVQQSAAPCPTCHGQGEFIVKADRCDKCHGKRLLLTEEKANIRIPKGTYNGCRIFPVVNSSFEDRVVFVLEQLTHGFFERRGHHIVGRKTVSLLQALTGLCFTITGVDGQPIRIASPPNRVTKPATTLRLQNHGMPKVITNVTTKETSEGKDGDSRGDLLLQIDVEFPETLPAQIQHILKRCLPPVITENDTSSRISSGSSKEEKTGAPTDAPTVAVATPIENAEAAKLVQDALNQQQVYQQQHDPHLRPPNMHQHEQECRTM